MKVTRLLILASLCLVALALPAAADTFFLTLGNTPIGVPPGTPGNWGTVTLTNTGSGSGGSGQVTIEVKLNTSHGIIFAGGNGRFGFNSNVALTGSMFHVLLQNDTFASAPVFGSTSYDGFGKFNVSWNGGSTPSGDELKFTITKAGVTTTNFEIASNKGFDFSAHVFDPSLTGSSKTLYVGNGTPPPPPQTPEPAGLLLLSSGLAGLAGFVRRKR